MERRIEFEIGGATFPAGLNDTDLADAVWNALPLEASFSRWGDEIYFDIGLEVDPAATHATVELGDVGYWPPGRALCLFYGPTPMSGPDGIRPASPVGILGHLEGDPKALKSVRGRQIRVRRLG